VGKIPQRIPPVRRVPMLRVLAELEEGEANRFQRASAMQFAKAWPVVVSNRRI
jgi:hypothetical protein